MQVKKTARLNNRYNQVPHLSQDTKWESNKITINITDKSLEVSPFPSGDNKATMNRRESMTNRRYKYNVTQIIQKRSTALEWSVKHFTGGLKLVSRRANLTPSSDMDQDI